MVKSHQDVAALNIKEIHKDANICTMYYGKGAIDFINWEIFCDAEHNIDSDFVPPSNTNVMKIFDFEWPMIENFFTVSFLLLKDMQSLLTSTLQIAENPIMKPWNVKNFSLMIQRTKTLTRKFKTVICFSLQQQLKLRMELKIIGSKVMSSSL